MPTEQEAMKRMIHALAAMGAALVFGCGGDPSEQVRSEHDPLDLTKSVYVDDGTYCSSGDLGQCELERECGDGDTQACILGHVRPPSSAEGDVEGPDYFTNADPDELLPTDPAPGVSLGGELGQSTQAFLSTIWYGWRLPQTGAPGFLDLASGQGQAPKNRCGTVAGQTCIFPKGPDLKTNWTWKWLRGFAGSPDPSCGQLNGNDDFLIGLRRAFSAWSQGSGITFTEVPDSSASGGDITIFCDGLTVDRLDPNHRMHAAWYPFGNTNGPQSALIHSEVGECLSDESQVVPTTLAGGATYLYSAGGIVLNVANIFGSLNGGWGGCAHFHTNPNALVNIGERVGAHEVAHALGFGHLQNVPWFSRKPTCGEIVDAASGSLNIPAKMKETFRGFVSQKRVELAGFTSATGFQVDRQLGCLAPDLTNGTATSTEGQ